ncbi:MAG: tRNA-intron lyase [Candidatus Bathyarchaeota archaeon]|nr:MAG: tRNA-intron lyase [Candidatus Bathyarchaeota archaeon]
MANPLARVEALTDSRLIVWSPEEARRLYNSGYYGKPLGIPKPREDFDAPLVLDPIEGLYLLEKGLIIVVSGSEEREVGLEELRTVSRGSLEGLDDKYLVYRDLREKGYVVAPGIKYGCDFAVYEEGPGVDHAPFLVKVKKSSDEITAAEIVEAGRLATTVRKTFIVAMVKGDKVRYLSFKWWKP